MTVIVQEVYTAFKEAGVSEESARSAAEALTGYGDRFHDLEREMDQRFSAIERKMDQRFNEMEREMDRRFNEVDQRFHEVDQRFNAMELKIAQRFGEVDRRFNDTDKQIMEVKGTQRLLQWMLGFNLALSVAVLFLLLRAGV